MSTCQMRPQQQWYYKCALLAALVAGLSACAGPKTTTEQVEIYRDNFGTPHIFADSNYGVYYGYGYAVASDRLYQMEILKRTVTGRVAEVLGVKFAGLDTHVRTGYDIPSVYKQVEDLSAADAVILQAYAAGMSQRIAEILAAPEQLLPQEFIHNDFLPEPWSAGDVAMAFVGAIAHRYSDFNSELDNLALVQALIANKGASSGWNAFQASKWLLDPDSYTTATNGRGTGSAGAAKPAMPSYLLNMASPPRTARVALDTDGRFAGITTDPKVDQAHKKALAKHGFGSSPEFAAASNLWAVNGKLPNAKGIFINGPQFGFSSPSYVYGVGLHGGDFDVTGNTLLALPALLFAHNNHLGWGSTAGLSDQVDVYVETLNPANPERFLHKGKWRDFVTWTETIKVEGAPNIKATARRSAHGMVIAFDPERKLAYSKARAWEGREVATLMAWINLAKDRTMKAARARIGKVATNINFYYMDRHGSLGYVHAGRYPKRAAGHDSRLPAPGTGEYDWLGFRPYSDNPHVLNPQAGYMINWNNRPRPDWISSDLWSHTWGRGDRVQLLIDELSKTSDRSLHAVWGINEKVSLRDVSAPFLLPFLAAALAKAKLTDHEQQAARMLMQWDQRWHATKRYTYHSFNPAAVLMARWLTELLQDVFPDDTGNFYHLYAPTNMPMNSLGASMNLGPGTKAMIRNLDFLTRGQRPDYDFFNGHDHNQVLTDNFKTAVEILTITQGKDMTDWFHPTSLMDWRPYNFRGVPQAGKDALISLPIYMNRGSENNIFIADGAGITGFDVIPPGQSGFISPSGEKSPHLADQLEMYNNYGFKPMPFSKPQVMQEMASKLVLQVEH